MIKKALLLAMAAVAVVAVSAPMASANWTHNGTPLSVGQDPHLQLTGQLLTVSAFGQIKCEIDMTIVFTGGSTTGEVKQIEIDLTEPGSTPTKKCTTGGFFAPCLVKGFHATGLPWTVHSNGADVITITTGETHKTLESPQGGPCSFADQVTTKPGTITATIPAGQTGGINEVTLSGQLETSTGAKSTVSGTLTANPSGTYGTA